MSVAFPGTHADFGGSVHPMLFLSASSAEQGSYIALHKKVNGYFALQYRRPEFRLRFCNRPRLTSPGCSGEKGPAPRTPKVARIGTGQRQKGRKTSENRLFCLIQSVSPRHDRGVGTPHGAPKGTRDGGIPCCGSGSEPPQGFVWVPAVLLPLSSR